MADELTVQRKLTHAFILTQPVEITLTPRAKVKMPAGGFVWQEGDPRAPQTMRLIEPSNSAPKPTVTADGIEREVTFFLLGEWDATIGLFDIFTHAGYDWEIVQLAHHNGWETRASVARYG